LSLPVIEGRSLGLPSHNLMSTQTKLFLVHSSSEQFSKSLFKYWWWTFLIKEHNFPSSRHAFKVKNWIPTSGHSFEVVHNVHYIHISCFSTKALIHNSINLLLHSTYVTVFISIWRARRSKNYAVLTLRMTPRV